MGRFGFGSGAEMPSKMGIHKRGTHERTGRPEIFTF